MSNYFISKDNKTGEIVYLEYDKNGYNVTPKTKKKDAIEVNKIVFVSPELTEKLLKKKINSKISKLLLELNTYDDEDDDSDGTRIRDKVKEAERLKLNIINKYQMYLGKSYCTLSLEKLQIIINGYRSRLYSIRKKKEKEIFIEMFKNTEMTEEKGKKGKGR